MSVSDDTPGTKNKNSANTQENQKFEGYEFRTSFEMCFELRTSICSSELKFDAVLKRWPGM